MAGPITLRRFSAPSGLGGVRFAPEVAVVAAGVCSSCCRFRLASKCGGSSAPIPDMVFTRFVCGWF